MGRKKANPSQIEVKRKISAWFSEVIKKRETDLDIYGVKIADELGVVRMAYYSIKNGKYPPSVEQLFRVAKALGLKVNIQILDENSEIISEFSQKDLE